MKNGLLKFYYTVSNRYKWRLLLLFVFPVIWCTAETIAPYIIKLIIDNLANNRISPKTFTEQLGMQILYYFSLICFVECAIRLCNYIWLQFIPDLRSHFRDTIITEVLEKPITFYKNHLLGDLVTKFKNLSNSFDLILASFLYGIFPVFVSSLLVLGFLFCIDILFAVFFIIWFVGMNSITFYFAHKNISQADKCAFHENSLLGYFGDLLRNIISIKIFRDKTQNHKRLISFQNAEVKHARALEWLTFKIDTMRSIISILVFLIMIVLLAWGYTNERLTLGDFSFVTSTCFYIRRSMWIASVNLLNLFKEIGIAKEAFNSLMNSKNSYKQPKTISKLLTNSFDIQLNSINFSYDEQNYLFKDLTLHIAEGQHTIVNGKSGCGKTTLMHIISNLLSVKSGKVLIGNAEIHTLTKGNIIYLPQQLQLFHSSIKENILYGTKPVSEKKITHVIKLTEAEQFITKLSDKYETIVGEDGIKLSSGQRQRIALARAILNEPTVLILDEATSALDKTMERNILKNIIHKTQIKTLIMISHDNTNSDLFHRMISFKNSKLKNEPVTRLNSIKK